MLTNSRYIYLLLTKHSNKIKFGTDILHLDNSIDKLHPNKQNDKSSMITQ